MSAVDVERGAGAGAGDTDTDQLISFDILRVTRSAQQQHGLRHGDLQRYRGYCARRLRRLRRAAGLAQGDRRHYRARDPAPPAPGDPRGHLALAVLAVQAERAWAHAMQLRRELATEPRKKYAMVRRLRKAALHADRLLELARAGACSARTVLEAQAYAAAMRGALLLELAAWGPAHDSLATARLVYTQLAGALPDDERRLYLDKAEELQPSLRYCAYNIGDETAAADLRDLRARGLTGDIDTLLAQAQAARSSDGVDVTWRGERVRCGPRARPLLAKLAQLEPALAAARDLADTQRLLDDALLDCKEALAVVREDLRAAPAPAPAPAPARHPALAYLTALRLELTARRNLALAAQAEARDPPRPADLARLYETLLHNYEELRDLPDLAGDERARDAAARAQAARALRAFYIARLLVGLRRPREALALLERAGAQAREARAAGAPRDLAARLATLDEELAGARLELLADAALAAGEDEAERGAQARTALAARLDVAREEPRALGRAPDVAALPPPPEPLACKPLLFDLACDLLAFPSLEAECGAGARPGLGGLVKGLLGWGAAR